MDTACNVLDALWSVVDGICRCHIGQECLSGADVGGSLVSSNVLLARLHGHAKTGLAIGVYGNANDATGHLARVGIGRREEASVRTTKAHGHTKALSRSNGNVGSPRAWRGELGQRHQVGGADDHGVLGVSAGGEVLVGLAGRFDAAIGVGILNNSTAVVSGGEVSIRVVADDDLNANLCGTSFDQGNGLRMNIVRHIKLVSFPLLALQRETHLHGLGGSGRFVQERGDAHGQAREVRAQSLEVEEHLQPSLGDLGLVRGVCRVPARILQYVAQNDGRDDGVVVALSKVGRHDVILVGHLLDLGQGLRFRQGRGQIQLLLRSDAGGDGGVQKGLH
mmetsp:Transcript_25785/g.74612  ORF Transcript_25785/g.74612 Transcript_25785/m.74612 type:complete len:335 (+) Transcript_25785:2033-3037(+)